MKTWRLFHADEIIRSRPGDVAMVVDGVRRSDGGSLGPVGIMI